MSVVWTDESARHTHGKRTKAHGKLIRYLLVLVSAVSLWANHDHGKGKGHNMPTIETPEPGTVGLMVVGGTFLIVAGTRRRKD